MIHFIVLFIYFALHAAEKVSPIINLINFVLKIVYVTVFWKTDHIDTKTEIHLLPVRDRHTHALSRNTKH